MHQAIKNSKLLIIDDVQSNIDLLINILELEGYQQIHHSSDSRKAMDLIHSLEPDLLILDLMMPHISGFEILEEVNTYHNEKWFMPVLVLTASNNPIDRQKALKLGAIDFLTKPFDITETSLRIKNILLTGYLFKQEKDLSKNLELKVKQRTNDLELEKIKAEKSERKYKDLFNSNTDAINISIVENNHLSTFQESNPANESILGYTPDELKSITIKTLIRDCDDKFLKDMIGKLREKKTIAFETTIETKSGKLKNIDVKCILIQYDGKEAILNIFRDITERVRFLDAIIAQNNVLKEIAWSQSHEVRAPLARLMGLTNLLFDYSAEDFSNDGKEILKLIRVSSEELDVIIKEISEKTYISNLFDHLSSPNRNE